MIPARVKEWLEENGYGSVIAERPVGGGCINQGTRLETEAAHSFFLKTNYSAPADMFAREAEGLHALQIPGGPRIPQPYLHASTFLLLEDLRPVSKKENYWVEMGQRLAVLHGHTHKQFGFHHDNYIGSTPQPNPWTPDGYTFFARQRIFYQAELAHENGYLGRADLQRAERVGSRLRDWIPDQPASLIHGDLWSGNAITDQSGEPALIDPAAHYGWAEAELAMTALFGGFPPSFYSAYQEVRPLSPGLVDRYPIYNLYHLLNHLNLFGTAYLGQVQSILRQYGN